MANSMVFPPNGNEIEVVFTTEVMDRENVRANNKSNIKPKFLIEKDLKRCQTPITKIKGGSGNIMQVQKSSGEHDSKDMINRREMDKHRTSQGSGILVKQTVKKKLMDNLFPDSYKEKVNLMTAQELKAFP